MAAKAYRFLRAVLMTAVEEDKILPRNPCRIRGAGDEKAAQRPVLTVAQVFALAEQLGRRPPGDIRNPPAGGYRLRFRRHGEMRTSPEVSERAAMIYQHQARGADQAITGAIDAHIEAGQTDRGDDDDGSAGALVPVGSLHANCTIG